MRIKPNGLYRAGCSCVFKADTAPYDARFIFANRVMSCNPREHMEDMMFRFIMTNGMRKYHEGEEMGQLIREIKP